MKYLPDEMWNIILRKLYHSGEYNLGEYIFNKQSQRVIKKIEQDLGWVNAYPLDGGWYEDWYYTTMWENTFE